MLYHFRPLLLALAGIIFIGSAALSAPADDSAARAAERYREKDFESAFTLAGKSPDLPRKAFICGMAAYQLNRFEEAVTFLADAEQKLPLVADYAALFQAEALLKLKRYPAAAAKAAAISSSFPSSRLVRRAQKLYADILFESGEYKGALNSYQAYVEKYPSGSDSIDAGFQLARCREELADPAGALVIYRNIWLTSPASPLAAKSLERIKLLESATLTIPPYTAEELLQRAGTLYAQKQYRDSLKTLDMIPAEPRPETIASRINLRAGMARYRLKQYQQAEQLFVAAAVSPVPGVRSAARFWLAKSLERQNLKEKALEQYLELAGEGQKQEFADDALIEAAGMKRGLGQYAEAARLYEQAAGLSPAGKTVSGVAWDAGWCRYLAGDYPAAAAVFKGLLADEGLREKALYWLGRTLEKSKDAAAVSQYQTLLVEFPDGFYAAWYREQAGIKDTRDPLGARNFLAEYPLPVGFDRPLLLASLGLSGEARAEMALLIKKNGEKKSPFPALARVYLEMQDYSSAISQFMQHRPDSWQKETLPLWTVGYPRAYPELVSRNAADNGLSEGFVYALIRAESRFIPAATSPVGAIGLMQMMPATAQMTSREKGDFNPRRLTEPEYNIRLGTKHLNDLMKEHDGDPIYTAAAYNAGSGALKRWLKSYAGLAKDEFVESIPYRETREYVKKVYASAATYRQLYGVK